MAIIIAFVWCIYTKQSLMMDPPPSLTPTPPHPTTHSLPPYCAGPKLVCTKKLGNEIHVHIITSYCLIKDVRTYIPICTYMHSYISAVTSRIKIETLPTCISVFQNAVTYMCLCVMSIQDYKTVRMNLCYKM